MDGGHGKTETGGMRPQDKGLGVTARRDRTGPPLELLEEAGPCRHPDLGFWPPEPAARSHPACGTVFPAAPGNSELQDVMKGEDRLVGSLLARVCREESRERR